MDSSISSDKVPKRRLAQPQLALWSWVIFVDWHNVLSNAPFWHTILLNDRHPYHHRLSRQVGELFSDSGLIDAWMRGLVDTNAVLAKCEIQFDRRTRENFLYRRLLDDGRRMPISNELIETLTAFRSVAQIVIATDNMDCLVSAIETRNDLRFADELLSSSDLGVLKAEDPHGFFGDWLREHTITFDNAILLDDSEHNCEAFSQVGGHVVQVRNPQQASDDLRSLWNQLNT